MKTKNGFTLIELLAVIVILAVIALIATPMIMGVIDEAREGSARESARGYIQAVEYQISLEMVKNPNATMSSLYTPFQTTVKPEIVDGTTPTSVSLTFDTNGKVAEGSIIKVGDYTFTLDSNGNLTSN